MSVFADKDRDEKSILIVEDSHVQASALKHLLEENGYTAAVGNTGIQAMDILRSRPFTLVISDINMPEMNGYEFCSCLKSDDDLKEIPVILLTSLSDPTDIIRGLQSGADNFITKPYDAEYLLARIQHLIINRQLRILGKEGIPLEINFRGEKYSINSDRQQILDLLISVFETAVDKNEKLLKIRASQYEMIELMAEKNIELLETHEQLQSLARHMEEQAQSITQARDMSNSIINSIADGIIVTDADRRVTIMNRAAEKFLGISFMDIENQSIDAVIRENSSEENRNDFVDKLKNEYEFDFILNTSGHEPEKIMHGKTSLIVDSNEKRQGTVTIISDVTYEREMDRMKTEFISTAAHELRTPLTSIQGFSEILMTRSNLAEEDKTRYLSYVNKQALKLANIVNDLLDIARIESGQGFVMNKQVYEVKHSLEEVIPCFSSISPDHRILLDIPHESIICLAEKGKIEQVIKNLISNSIKYTPESGIIRVKGQVYGDFFRISVEDNGIGMTSAQVSRIFEKFYRVNASDSAPDGTGLGMTIVKYIVEAHGGRVWVDSEFGKGTKVFFTIPLHCIER